MTFIDFFAGIGRFRAGLTQAGFRCVGFCEKDKYAVKSYRAIHAPDEKEWFSDDIQALESSDIPYAEGWTAGFPCGDISLCGGGSGLRGRRSGLFFEIVRLIKGKAPEDKPRWLLLENVKNLLSIGGGRDFTEVLYQISATGYDCEWQIINSKSYVPQNRERVFIIGHLRDGRSRKVFPVGITNAKTPVELVGGSQGRRVYDHAGIEVTLTAEGGGGAKTGLYFIDLNKDPKITDTARCVKAQYDAGITNHKGSNSGVFVCGRIGKDAAHTLTASCKQGVVTLTGRIRRLTPLESFRLQGYSDEMFYKARAVNSDNQLYKQIGNSVTVPVIRDIGGKLREAYHANGKRYKGIKLGRPN
jgi:DNA (cytosine-5)-methyltransferase 1